jgi:hypothetical protein
MFEVTKYEPPRIFVTSHQTGETHSFLVGNNGALSHNKARSVRGAARQAAIAYLAWFSKARGRLVDCPSMNAVFFGN